MYLNSIKLSEVYEDTMFVRNVVKDERQHECSTPITSIHGKNTQRKDTIGTTE